MLRDFRHPLGPPSLQKCRDTGSNVPAVVQIQNPAAPGEIDVPETSVCRKLKWETVPSIFTSLSIMGDYMGQQRAWGDTDDMDVDCDGWVGNVDEMSEDHGDESICIEDNKLNRLLLHHAFMGFTFESAPLAMRTILRASPLVKEQTEMEMSNLPLDIEDAARRFKHRMLVFNIHMLSTLLTAPSGWAFTIALESSSCVGVNGLQARLCVYGPRASHLSFHLIGVENAPSDIQRLHELLLAISPTFHLKLLGLVTDLDDKGQVTKAQKMVSATACHFARLVPARRPFYSSALANHRKRPPLLPAELVAASAEEVKELVHEYRNMLEASWNSEDIATIERQHELLRREPKENFVQVGLVSDPPINQGMDRGRDHKLHNFNQAWQKLGPRFGKLRDFTGGLATAYMYAPKPRGPVKIAKIESRPSVWGPKDNQEDADVDARNVVLQACQFEELRSYLGG